MVSTDELLEEILGDPFANVTFSGGDPMFQPEGFTELAEAIREKSDKTIWCYSGFRFEQILLNEKQRKLLEKVDVLVDGPFVEKLRDEDLYFRGSSNQRIIDVKKSLTEGNVVLVDLP